MKKLKIFTACLFLTATQLKAQIPNPGFENFNTCNVTANWSHFFLLGFTLDSLGNTVTDSIVYDGVNYVNSPTSDAHSGNWALSIRNAYNYTQNSMIAGKAVVFEDSSFCSAGYVTLLPMMPIPNHPAEFSFWYKYLPVNNDTAYAEAVLTDSLGYEIATAKKIITTQQTTYVQEVIPFNYQMAGEASFYSIRFSTSIPDEFPHQISLGTRLLIDDVNFAGNSSIPTLDDELFTTLFPNPAFQTFSIRSTQPFIYTSITIMDMHGNTLVVLNPQGTTFDCSGLNPGMYLVKIATTQGSFYKKLMVKN
jgi:hypothetical protein